MYLSLPQAKLEILVSNGYSEKLWCFLVHHRCLIFRAYSLYIQETYSPVTTQLVTRGRCGSTYWAAGLSGSRCRQSSGLNCGCRISAVSGATGLGTAGQSSLYTHWVSPKGPMNCSLCNPKPVGDRKKRRKWRGKHEKEFLIASHVYSVRYHPSPWTG